MAIYSGFSHEKWCFSIAMLVYQRVSFKVCKNPNSVGRVFWDVHREG